MIPSRVVFASIEAAPIAGTVKDSLGNLLSGVEVLFVALPAPGFRPTAVARSGRDGRFKVTDLVPGPYRVAALKEGYRTFVGQVDTPGASSALSEELRQQSAERIPMRRIGTVNDIATCALYLASPAGSWVTGKVFHVDGGAEAAPLEFETPPL